MTRGLEDRPAPAHLPADRAHLRPGHRRPGQGHPRRPALADPRRASATTCWRPSHPRSVQGRQHVAGGGLDRRGNLLPAPVPRHQRLRRPRGLLGTPLRRRPRPGQRAVLRLLRLGRHHDARGARPARARAGPADDRLLLPPRPGPRPGPGADRDARRRHPARRHPVRLRLRPPRRRGLGHPAARRRRAAGPGPAPAPTAAPAAPTTAPSSPTGTCTARPRPGRCWNSGRWPATPPRTRPPPTTSSPPSSPGYKLGRITSRRRRRLPPGHVPRRHGQDPLPAPPGLHDPGPRPARDPHPARAPARLLHPADHHRPARRRRQDPAETRLPVQGRTAGPTPGAPAPSGPSPPPRTPPATTSPAAGPGSWA